MAKKSVETYLAQKTQWQEELTQLRALILSTGLGETVKWGAPCYVHQGQNVVGLLAFKDYFGLWFYLGARLADDAGVLINAQEGKTRDLRQWRMTSAADIRPKLVKTYLEAAKRLAESGEKPTRRAASPDAACPELAALLDADPKAKTAYAALTPGRRREYAAHINAAKRAATREKRALDALPLIRAGKGLNDKYR
ncbi:MAG: DUF1801 domain-containing protein [Pseudomonadota bacterium]